MAFCLRPALVACFVLLFSVSSDAREGRIELTMMGEAYNGPPKFRLSADGREIGIGAVTNAIDTQAGAKLEFGKNGKLPLSNTFSFKIPNIDTVSRLDVEFTNDDWAGPGKPGDRNLYLLSLSVSTSRKVPDGSVTTILQFSPTAFVPIMPKPGGSKVTAQYAALNNAGSFRLARPKDGWGPGAVGQADVAAGGKPGCKLAPIELKGFEMNTAGLSPKMLEQLAGVSKLLAGNSCAVVVTAFTGGGSSEAFRKGLSQARAQMAANELIRLGVPSQNIKTETAAGGGRRAVISFR